MRHTTQEPRAAIRILSRTYPQSAICQQERTSSTGGPRRGARLSLDLAFSGCGGSSHMTDGPSPVVFVWSGWHRALVLADGWIIRRPKETTVNRVPDSELVLVPGGTLITPTPEEGRALALTLARHSIHNIQPDLDVLMSARPVYSVNPDSLIAASQVVAIEFQTIAAANNYWRS